MFSCVYQKEFTPSKFFNKEDYDIMIKEICNDCCDYYCYTPALHLDTHFECEKAEVVSEFLVERGIFDSLEDYKEYCRIHCQLDKIETIWDVLDLLYDKGEDEVKFLCEYAELHRDFGDASYNKCLKYFERELRGW